MAAEPVGQRTAPTPGQSETLDINAMEWTPTKHTGICIKVLHQDEETGASTILFKFDPGAKTPLHEHMGVEQVLILEGGLQDHDGFYPAGTYIRRIAGSVHQATAPNGSLHLAFFSKKNRMLDDESLFP
jgi:anti-sigma factor ChrR (cupin superfamily)